MEQAPITRRFKHLANARSHRVQAVESGEELVSKQTDADSSIRYAPIDGRGDATFRERIEFDGHPGRVHCSRGGPLRRRFGTVANP